MTDKTSINREALVKITALVRPALAAQACIPALTHIKFDGEYASAYNDIGAIMVKAPVEVECCLPGELLIKALGSFGAETIAMQESVKDKAVVMSSGRAKIKMPTLPLSSFPFALPDLNKAPRIVLNSQMLRGVNRCLMSVGNDPTHPAQMGVTLDVDSRGNAILFSTDNFTISRYATDNNRTKLPGDAPIIMPTFFCQQLVTLAKAFEDEEAVLYLVAGALVVEFGEVARLFNKTLVDLAPLDFPRIFDKHCKIAGLKDRLSKIPDNWDGAFNRAMLVLDGEVDKVTRVTVTDDAIKLHSTSSMGDSDDSMSHDADVKTLEPFYIDPSLVTRASKAVSLMAFNEKALSLADDEAQFVHLIAYCSK